MAEAQINDNVVHGPAKWTGPLPQITGKDTPQVSFSGGRGDGVDSTTQAYVDARTDAVRAQNDARFAEVLSEIRGVREELRHVPTFASMLGTAAGTVIAIVGLMVAIWSYAGDRFDGGVQVSSVSVQQAVDAKRIAEESENHVKALNDKMDLLLQAVGEKVRK